MSENPTFILAGNGPYDNRGCEAIVRGTVKILRHYYKDPSFLCISNFQNNEQFELQYKEEWDKAITHKKTERDIYEIFTPKYFFQFAQRKMTPRRHRNNIYKGMFPTIKEAEAVLSIGGDNYSLDYGIPKLFTELDNLVIENKKPMIIWGASVGPFDRMPKYEKYMKKHLQHVTGIFARESATVEYLERIGIIDNVYMTSDPAFLLDASKPQFKKEIEIEEESIGINLSPLMAKYVSNGNMNNWVNIASNLVEEIAKRADNKIYLIPHVTVPNSNDYWFLKDVRARIRIPEEKITLIPPIYNAGEIKWIISKMKLFAGARTHSTIAALSSCIPTLSFAYSIKAKGINRDVFGSDEYCMNPEDISPKTVADKIEMMSDANDKIRSNLKASIPNIEKKAILAGKYLQEIMGQT